MGDENRIKVIFLQRFYGMNGGMVKGDDVAGLLFKVESLIIF